MSTAGRTNLKQQLYNDDIDESKVRDYFISFASRYVDKESLLIEYTVKPLYNEHQQDPPKSVHYMEVLH
jgi:hypothetical protein